MSGTALDCVVREACASMLIELRQQHSKRETVNGGIQRLIWIMNQHPLSEFPMEISLRRELYRDSEMEAVNGGLRWLIWILNQRRSWGSQ